MKSYIINVEGRTETRSIAELNTLLEFMIEIEEYELCSAISQVIENYDELVKHHKQINNRTLMDECMINLSLSQN